MSKYKHSWLRFKTISAARHDISRNGIKYLLLGLQTLYVNAGTTVSVAGVYDYLALFVWGVTADVGSTSLINLAQKAGKQNQAL